MYRNKIRGKVRTLILCCMILLISTWLAACEIVPESVGQAGNTNAETADQAPIQETGAETETAAGRHRSADPDQPDKEESVYVEADASGKAEDITVNVTLKNPGDDQPITDVTNLKGIRNKEGDEEFTESADGKLTWENHGEDIVYEGTSSSLLPVNVAVTYYLDGSEVSPEDLAGKSGEVKIRFDYQVDAEEKVTVREEARNADVPFVCMTMMVLPDEHFDSIRIDNGKMVSMDEQTIVIGYAVPGLAESMNLAGHEMTEEIDVPEYVEVTAYATDFELDFTATVVSNGLFKEIEDDDLKDFDEMMDDMDELADASKELVDGTKELADGAKTFSDYLSQYTEGVSAVSKGLSKLSDGTKTLNDNKDSLADGAQQLRDGLSQMDESLQQYDFDGEAMMAQMTAEIQETIETAVAAAVAQIQANASEGARGSAYAAALAAFSENEAFAALSDEEKEALAGQIAAGTQENFNALMAQQAEAGAAAEVSETTTEETSGTETGTDSLAGSTDLAQLGEMLTTLKESVHALAQGSAGLYDGIVQYNEGISGVHEGVSQLYDGTKKLDSAGDEMTEGYDAFVDGTKELHEGFEEFDKEGIQELTKTADEDLDDLLTRLRTLKAVDQAYNNFTGLEKDQTGSVRFIIETEGIKP